MNKAQREYDYQNLSIGVDADWTILPGLSFKPALSLFEVNSNNYTFWDAFEWTERLYNYKKCKC